MDGIFVSGATIHLHGDATATHSNGRFGIIALDSKVIIHLPSHHNTSYNNGREDQIENKEKERQNEKKKEKF